MGYLLLSMLCINLIDKPIYAHADLNNKTHITRYAKLFPLYQPLTVKRLAQQWGIDVNREFDYQLSKSGGMMNYPLAMRLIYPRQGTKNNLTLYLILQELILIKTLKP